MKSKEVAPDQRTDRPDPEGKREAAYKTLKIVLVYFVIGCAWILATDLLSNQIFGSLPEVLRISVIKGLFYVAVTSAILFGLVYSPLRKLHHSEKSILAANRKLEQSNARYAQLNRELEEKQSLLKSLMDASGDMIYYLDDKGCYLGCNHAYEIFIGHLEQELIGNPFIGGNKGMPGPPSEMASAPDLQSGLPGKYEIQAVSKSGEIRTVEILNAPFRNQEGDLLGILSVGRDMTERRNREERIEYMSRHDALTGLSNRHFFEEQRHALEDPSLLPLSVVVCDVDGLKLVNDAFGHEAGDRILLWASGLLLSHCKRDELVIRTGGDEFYVFYPNTGQAEAEEIFDSIRRECVAAGDGKEPLDKASISIGFATRESVGASLEETIIEAEDYMYRRKLLARKGVHSTLMKSITATLHEKSLETQAHCDRMANWARELGERLRLSNKELDILELAASLHDLGKISVDLSILQKTGPLTPEEWQIIRKHPETGWRITQAIPELNPISELILSHHEWWDGRGYPRGLAGEEIPLMARIISVVDAYDAMIEERPYRAAMNPETARQEIIKMAGVQFDPEVVRVFTETIV